MRGTRAGRMLAIAGMCVACNAEAKSSAEEEAAACRTVQPSQPLPGGLPESSGVAASRRHAGVLWTHNDSGKGELVAVDATGRLVGRSTIVGVENEDWEDLELGPCAAGDCLYIADTGDNDRKRVDTAIYRVPEPAPGAAASEAERLEVRYPGGSRDTEAMFVLPSGEIYLISKGRKDARTLYRYRTGAGSEVEKIVDLGPAAKDELEMITAASASPSGEWVAVREYKRLAIYRTADLLAGRATPALDVDLSFVGEAQGEAVALLDNGRVILTSEGGFKDTPGTFAILQCDLPGE